MTPCSCFSKAKVDNRMHSECSNGWQILQQIGNDDRGDVDMWCED